MRQRIAKLGSRHALIGDVRGAGLFTGVELVTDRIAKTPATTQTACIVNGLRERGVLLSGTGEQANILKIRPPMVFTEAHADLLVDTLSSVLDTL